MSNWSATQLTDAGRALDAKVTGGLTTLSFTKMKLGSGATTAADIPSMTDLTTPELVLGISSCAVAAADPTVCEVISIASSDDVSTSFVVRELGIFATDPDDGEILYAVMLDSTPDTMPNSSVASPVTVTYQVNIVSANASSITAVIDPAGLVNVAALNAAINTHNSSAASHPQTINDTVAPTSDSAPMPTILNNIATMLKSISGETGWKSVPAKSLAALVSSLATGITVAADGTFSNPTLGISGLMAQNGYICFGKNFGGLILQWGTASFAAGTQNVPTNSTITFPVAYRARMCQIVVTTSSYTSNWADCAYAWSGATVSTVTLVRWNTRTNPAASTASWIAVGC